MSTTRHKSRNPSGGKQGKTVIASIAENGVDDERLTELLESYRRLGELLEAIVGRDRIYRADFIKGLNQALGEVDSKKTRRVKSFADFTS